MYIETDLTLLVANRERNELKEMGGGPLTEEYTPAEELALCSNEGCLYKKNHQGEPKGFEHL